MLLLTFPRSLMLMLLNHVVLFVRSGTPMMEEAEKNHQDDLYFESKMNASNRGETREKEIRTAHAARRANHAAVQQHQRQHRQHRHHVSGSHHAREDDEHLSDHEDDQHTNLEEEHDLEVVTNHEFGSEHTKLLHDINVIQCMILVSIDSTTQHAGFHEHAHESLPMAINNIPYFTSTRLVEYLKTFVHLVRGGEVSATSATSKNSNSNSSKNGKNSKNSKNSNANTNKTSPIILAWQMSSVIKVIHIMATGSHHLRRKMNTHASEEIRFYLCQRKFVDNIDPHVLYNGETLQMLWEVLWECLEARKTNDMTLLERVNYRSPVIMWNWRDVIEEAEERGEGVEMTTEELMMDKKKGSIDHSAHAQYNNQGKSTGSHYYVKLKRTRKHRKMFPGFYRGEFLAPSGESISRHNKLIKKLLGEELSKSVLQNRQHNGVTPNDPTIRKTLFSGSDEHSSSSSSDEDDSSSEDEEGDDDGGKGATWMRQHGKHAGRYDDAAGDVELSSGDDSDDDEYDGRYNVGRRDTSVGKSSFGEYKSKGRVVRRSVVARNIKGFSQAAKNVMGMNRLRR